jgi:hypothetical protein
MDVGAPFHTAAYANLTALKQQGPGSPSEALL